MISFALRRLAGLVPTLFVLVTLSFFVIRLAPGGPFDQQEKLSPEVLANVNAAYGLDQPLVVQYGHYLAGLVRGDLGPSFRYKDFSVTEVIAGGLPLSLTIGLAAALLGGCAPALVGVETARAAACIAAEEPCIRRGEAGESSLAEVRACVAVVRTTCDLLRERLHEGSDAEGTN